MAASFIVVVSFAQTSSFFVKDKYAVGGYDVVAYFTEGKAVKGNIYYSVQWENANWQFSTKLHADMFKANPEKYAPQYGGYCAYGCSRGYKAKTEGEAFTIINGKLYLNYNLEVRNIWNKDQQEFIKKAEKNWPKVRNTVFEN